MKTKRSMQLKVFYWALMAILFTIVAWLNTEPFIVGLPLRGLLSASCISLC